MSILYILLTLQICLSLLYVDFKNNYITPGISVFHGYFEESGIYRFFIGDDETINNVSYGGKIIYPAFEITAPKYVIFVEYFKYNIEFIIVHFDIDYEVEHIHIRTYFRFQNNTYERVTFIPKEFPLGTIVYISLDINSDSKVHPFISKSSYELNEYFRTVYELKSGYKGYKFGVISNPRYAIGSVHDSNLPVFVLYNMYETLALKCNSVTLVSREQWHDVKIDDGSYSFNFNKVKLYSSYSWIFYKDQSDLIYSYYSDAIDIKNKVQSKTMNLIGLINLDVEENFSPKIHNIIKSTGTLAIMGYTIYQSAEDSNPIVSVMDTSFVQVLVHLSGPGETIIFVEVIVDFEKRYIVVTSVIDVKGSEQKKHEVYEKPHDGYNYVKLLGHLKLARLESFKEHYPVSLNIDLDDTETTFIYERKLLNDDKYKFIYFYINDYHEGENVESKYVFGTLSEIDPFEVGNIPCEKFRRKYRIIRENLNCSEFIVRNPFEQKQPDTSSYEVYVPIT